MEIEHDSLDDVLMSLYKVLPTEGMINRCTRGENRELLGVSLRIRNPRARLSRSENRGKLFSALGELLWYLSGQNDLEFIRSYIPVYKDEADDDGTVYGGYGPRLFNMRGEHDQFSNVAELLKERPGSRRAVVQLFNAEDIASVRKEVPCTTTMQFFQREGRLYMAATLRSNDAYKGLPHDVFCFTMLQEMMARRLDLELGEYYQFVGSMHVYDEDIERLRTYTDEGYHKLSEMPSMPSGDPFQLVPMLLECESRMRNSEDFDASSAFEDPYWADIIRLLQAFWARGKNTKLDELSSQFVHTAYRSYLENRRHKSQ